MNLLGQVWLMGLDGSLLVCSCVLFCYHVVFIVVATVMENVDFDCWVCYVLWIMLVFNKGSLCRAVCGAQNNG